MQLEWHRDGYTIGTDPAWLDLGVIHGFLAASYWATGIPREVVRRSIEHSINFGVYATAGVPGGPSARASGSGATPGRGSQVGFARVITDRATFGYLGDVFVLESHRGCGLSKWLMECIDAHPDLQGFRRWVLLTRDAHGLYRRFGFTSLAAPERYLERWAPNVYGADQAPAPARPESPA